MFKRATLGIILTAVIYACGRHVTIPDIHPLPSGWAYPNSLKDALNKPTSQERDDAVLALLSDPDNRVRFVAISALETSAGGTVQALIRSLGDSNIFVRSIAVRKLVARTSGIQALLDGDVGPFVILQVLPYLDSSSLSEQIRAQILEKTEIARCRDRLCLLKPAIPHYPPLARQAQLSGAIRMEFTLDESGRPRELKTSGHPLLIAVAEAALTDSRFAGPQNERHAMTIRFATQDNSAILEVKPSR